MKCETCKACQNNQKRCLLNENNKSGYQTELGCKRHSDLKLQNDLYQVYKLMNHQYAKT